MNTQLIAAILVTARSVLSWLTAKRQGNAEEALDILRAVDLSSFGLDEDVLEVVGYAQVGLSYLTSRGIIIEEVVKLIKAAEEEGRDITIEEIKQQLNLTKVELDETQDLIDTIVQE